MANAARLHFQKATFSSRRGGELWSGNRLWTSLIQHAGRDGRQATVSHASQLTGGLGEGLSGRQRRAVSIWLGGCAAWVFSLVVLGGVTRLTRSGLSMTDWKFTGERPPSSQADWEAEFSKYQQSAEYRKVNRSMKLEEFKFIYWMEYAHRMWGRLLGLVFLGPAAVFAASGHLNKPLAKRVSLLLLMGGTQGLVGWWMVRSGLQDPESEHATPRVSPYRLAAHLGSAFLIYSILAWSALDLAFPKSAAATASRVQASGAAALRRYALPLTALLALTSMSGAFVAGLDAGHAYNTFPLMAGRLVPEDYRSLPGWRNAFENTAAVQFHHRLLALTSLSAVLATALRYRHSPLPRPSKLLLQALAGLTVLQVSLGISTLLMHVPPSLGSAHQATALALLTSALALLHTLRPTLTRSPGPVARLASPAAAAAVVVIGVAVTQIN